MTKEEFEEQYKTLGAKLMRLHESTAHFGEAHEMFKRAQEVNATIIEQMRKLKNEYALSLITEMENELGIEYKEPETKQEKSSLFEQFIRGDE